MIISVKQIKSFLISILIPLLVGYSSSKIAEYIAGLNTSTYYTQLIKPGFAPPGFIFPIVWTILYTLMGISSYLIIKKGYDLYKIKDAMFYYWLQLALNFVWSILFFGLDLRFASLVTIVILIIVLCVMIYKFYKINKAAGLINLPYLIWLLYALLLNYFIWIINR